jgi:hypothetical protein
MVSLKMRGCSDPNLAYKEKGISSCRETDLRMAYSGKIAFLFLFF